MTKTPKKRALTVAQAIAKLEDTMEKIHEIQENECIISPGDTGEDSVNVEVIMDLTGLGLDMFVIGSYIQANWLDSDIPEATRDALEKAWLKYNNQLRNTMVLIGPLLVGIEAKRNQFLVDPSIAPKDLRNRD